jgi:hypothetical protein
VSDALEAFDLRSWFGNVEIRGGIWWGPAENNHGLPLAISLSLEVKTASQDTYLCVTILLLLPFTTLGIVLSFSTDRRAVRSMKA